MPKSAASAISKWQARKILYECQIAANAVDKGSVFVKLECFPEGLFLETQGAGVFVTPYDYLDNSLIGEQVLARISEIRKSSSKTNFEIWNAGKVTKDFSISAAARSVLTRGWLLF